MFRKYGKVAVGVHFAVYFTGLGGKERKRKTTGGGGECSLSSLFLTHIRTLSLSNKRTPLKLDSKNTETACYIAVERGVKVDKFLRGWGLMGEKKEREGGADAGAELPRGAGATVAAASTSGQRQQLGHEDDEDDDGRNWFARALSGRGSSLALAFVANKALFPVRAPITLGLTPAVARALRVNAARSAASAASAGGCGKGGKGGGGGSGGSGSNGGGGGGSPQ